MLRQLVAWLGDEAFLAGLNAHFAAHAYGNATLADLLAALTAASGRDLSDWAELWLRRAQVNTLRAEVSVADDGTYTEVAVVQTAPPEHPTLRPHRIGVGRYDRDAGPAPVTCAGPDRGGPRPGRRRRTDRADRADRRAGRRRCCCSTTVT